MKNNPLKLFFLFFTFFIIQVVNAQPCINTTQALPGSPVTICAQSPFLFYGQSIDVSGTYSDTFVVTGGCDSIIYVQISVLPSPVVDWYDTICQGGYVLFLGDTLTTSTIISDTTYTSGTVNTYQCDSITNLYLTVLPAIIITRSENVTFCSVGANRFGFGGTTYDFYGSQLNRSGFYTDTVTGNASGITCIDTIVTLDLTVIPAPANTNINASQCGGTYTFYGHVLSASGTYTDTLTSASGCDSLIVLTLSIGAIPAYSVTGTACPGSSFIYHGVAYPAPTGGGGFGPPPPATYYDTIPGHTGCDSIITITVYQNMPIPPTAISAGICPGTTYDFNGQLLSTAGVYTDTFTALSTGCDSIVNLTLSTGSYFSGPSTTVNGYTCGFGSSFVFRGISYQPTGFFPATYYDTVPSLSGCDTIFTINVSASPGIPPTAIAGSICAGQHYTFAGRNLTVAGTYIDTFTATSTGCDSIVTLTLSVGSYFTPPPVTGTACVGSYFVFRGIDYPAPGFGFPPAPATYYDTVAAISGCDTVFTIIVSLGQLTTFSIVDSFCPGSSYLYMGTTYTAPGTYSINTGGGGFNACDTVITLTLTSRYQPTIIKADSFCYGSAYYYHGDSFSTSGTDTLYRASATPGACDSVFILSLTYRSAPAVSVTDSFCEGFVYTYRSYTFSDSGTHLVTLPTATGCDTVVTLYLSYQSAPSYTVTDSFCEGFTYYYRGDSFTTNGMHFVTVPSPSGCDTVITLMLNYKAAPHLYLNTTFCQGTTYSYHGHSFTVPILDTFAIPAPAGCDSIIFLTLNYGPPLQLTVTDSFCPGTTYWYRSDSFSASGTYTVNITSPAACDTTVTLDLSYKATGPTVSISSPGNNELSVGTFVASYQWYLNGVLIPGATNNFYSYTQSGSYTVVTTAFGSSCPQTSAAVNAIYNGISEVSSDMFTLYPNPNSGRFTIAVPQFAGTELTIYDVLGRTVYQAPLAGAQQVIDMKQATGGTYFMILRNPQFTRFAHFVIAQ